MVDALPASLSVRPFLLTPARVGEVHPQESSKVDVERSSVPIWTSDSAKRVSFSFS